MKSYPINKYKNAVAWMTNHPCLLSANAETVDYQLSQMFMTLGKRNQQNYYKVNPSLKTASPEMDNVKKKISNHLYERGCTMLNRTMNYSIKSLKN